MRVTFKIATSMTESWEIDTKRAQLAVLWLLTQNVPPEADRTGCSIAFATQV